MAQATTNAAIEATLHAAITKEAAEKKISFSEQVNRYRALALTKMREDADKKKKNSNGGINDRILNKSRR